jgi:hypothetical protein
MIVFITIGARTVTSGTCEILPIGDSITAGGGPPSGSIEDAATYRHRLEVLLERNGVAANFVGDVCRNCNQSSAGQHDHRCNMGCKRGPEKDKFIAFWSVAFCFSIAGFDLQNFASEQRFS